MARSNLKVDCHFQYWNIWNYIIMTRNNLKQPNQIIKFMTNDQWEIRFQTLTNSIRNDDSVLVIGCLTYFNQLGPLKMNIKVKLNFVQWHSDKATLWIIELLTSQLKIRLLWKVKAKNNLTFVPGSEFIKLMIEFRDPSLSFLAPSVLHDLQGILKIFVFIIGSVQNLSRVLNIHLSCSSLLVLSQLSSRTLRARRSPT